MMSKYTSQNQEMHKTHRQPTNTENAKMIRGFELVLHPHRTLHSFATLFAFLHGWKKRTDSNEAYSIHWEKMWTYDGQTQQTVGQNSLALWKQAELYLLFVIFCSERDISITKHNDESYEETNLELRKERNERKCNQLIRSIKLEFKINLYPNLDSIRLSMK